MSPEFFTSTNEAAAFGLFCEYVEGTRAILHLDQIAPEQTISATELRAGFIALARRGLVDVLQDLRHPDRLVVEFPNPEAFETPDIPPAAYFTAAETILATRRARAEVL